MGRWRDATALATAAMEKASMSMALNVDNGMPCDSCEKNHIFWSHYVLDPMRSSIMSRNSSCCPTCWISKSACIRRAPWLKGNANVGQHRGGEKNADRCWEFLEIWRLVLQADTDANSRHGSLDFIPKSNKFGSQYVLTEEIFCLAVLDLSALP